MLNDNEKVKPKTRENRTVIAYFGKRDEYVEILENNSVYFQIVVETMRLSAANHKDGCDCDNRYTTHKNITRPLKNFRGEGYEVPIKQVKCLKCKAVFTVLPSFIARYQRMDVDGLSKILEINLVMATSYRHSHKILEYAQGVDLAFNPGRMLAINQWLGSLVPLQKLLILLDLDLPETFIEDQKFVRENGNKTYVSFLSHKEVIWWIDYINETDETRLTASLNQFLVEMRKWGMPDYNIKGVTYDGWKPSKAAFESINPKIKLQECQLHAKMRMTKSLPLLEKQHPELSDQELTDIKKQHDEILDARSRTSYSQRLRRFCEKYGHLPEVAKRCNSLKNKILLFLAFLTFKMLERFSTSLDQIIKFFDRKFYIMQTFRNDQSALLTLNAFAIVRNFWRYMPGAKRENLSPVEIAGANLHGIPWLEFVNLSSRCEMDPLNYHQTLVDSS